jgi:hypothetical protein
MTKQVSPAFAVIAVLVALALGTLYFFARLRAHDAREEAIARAAQAQRDAAIESGRYGQMRDRMAGARSRAPGGADIGAPDAEANEEPAADSEPTDE